MKTTRIGGVLQLLRPRWIGLIDLRKTSNEITTFNRQGRFYTMTLAFIGFIDMDLPTL